ncbi:MAG: N-acetylmuramoyl-L-alanine amidase [Roseburia sp.]|nr:N-acetylmuramoyl-L-alanine amidase [Roseburia sp.]MCM1098295.1 N-acetylmuramoyl-L-alanine amidase [Ruminococcus flavefaciens]
MQSSERQKQWEPDIIDIRRDPYAVSFEQRRRQRAAGDRQINSQRRVDPQRQANPQRGGYPQRSANPRRTIDLSGLPVSQRSSGGQTQTLPQRSPGGRSQTLPQRSPGGQTQALPQRRTEARRPANPAGNTRSRRAALQRRRKYIRRQRIAVGVFIGCIAAAFCLLIILPNKSSAAGANRENRITREQKDGQSQTAEPSIQGLPATVFSSHPVWTEDFLTPNEFSRPGEALPEVKNIFVHYTANPGTSASQNRSYFEQQKDTHQVSVSAHFIIGYEGEILQCVPLDEIAYAVQTRNYDSISIECCYKAADGSFTQETYDSLISLLAWLTEAYDLDPEDILRHYDCGGKKCPLYYTEHPDAWERLKEDVTQTLSL